jgi:hypothetical protein
MTSGGCGGLLAHGATTRGALMRATARLGLAHGEAVAWVAER